MKRITKYIVAFVAMIVATACSMNELQEPTFPSYSEDNLITISPRISHFTDYNVSTRSSKEGDEAKVTSMAMALFPIINKVIQPAVYYQYNDDGNMLFVLDRNLPPFTDSQGVKHYEDQEFVMYIIANMQDADIPMNSGYVDENGKVAVYQSDGTVVVGDKNMDCGAGWSIDEFATTCVHQITDGSCFEDISENGFPMLGRLGDRFYDHGDNNTFIFHPKENPNNVNGLPTVNGVPTDNLEISMRSLYAKFTFTISVESDQEVVGHAAPRFDLSGYKVVNAAKEVCLERTLNQDNENTGYASVVSSEFHNVATQGLYAQGATKATFSFYVPERTFDPSVIPLDTYVYDLGLNGAPCVGYDKIPDDMKKYAQRFKPELAKGLNATHVEIKGKFTDHQKHVYDVTYKIYLGADNYGNFDIIRNGHYNNFITIRGIDNSEDQSADYNPGDENDDAPISIDHRVSIERSTPLVVGLRRETLLDAHFEVRPLRLHLSGGDDNNPTDATVTLMKARNTDPELSTWIGMEKSGNTNNHITETGTPSDGKRKYFTTNLVSELSGNTSIKIDGLNYDANQTVWLYVDENLSTNSRSAILRIQYNYKDPITQEIAAPEDYVITQHGLHKVVGAYSGRDYYIEEFEEYLYNYDVEDLFGQTKEEGMPWGLDGVQLSKEHESFKISENNTSWVEWKSKNPNLLTYDFYIWQQDSVILKNNGIYDTEARHDFAGQHFTEVIINNTKSNTQLDQKVIYRRLNEPAGGAVEYCYNRNKINPDTGEVDVVWYLPSADELEDFIVTAYSSFKEFQDNYYWTSQPAYTRNVFYYEYKKSGGFLNLQTVTEDAYAFTVYEDNKQHARATKVLILGNEEFAAAKSGLNKEPKEKGTFDPKSYENNPITDTLGYFNTWNQWKKSRTGDATTTPLTTDQWYDEIKDEKSTSKRYYAFVNEGYVEEMKQEGYHDRTKSNRVRCAYKKAN